jgi:YaiO family outer membrane protein
MTPVKQACLLASLVMLSAHPAAHASLFREAASAADSRQFDRAERLLRDWLKTHVGDKEAHLLLGKVLMRQGRRAEALAEFDELLNKRPQNPYYLLAKAETLINDGRPQEALPLLKLARSVKPSKEEIWRLQLTALLEAGGEDRRLQAAAILKEAKYRFPSAKWDELDVSKQSVAALEETRQPFPSAKWNELDTDKQYVPTEAKIDRQPEYPQPVMALKLAMEVRWRPGLGTQVVERPPSQPPKPPATTEEPVAAEGPKPETKFTEVEVGFSYDRLDNDYDPWQASYITANRQFNENSSAYATLRQSRKFGLVDKEIWAGYYTRPIENWNANIEGSFSPTHKTQARWSLYGQLGHTFDNGIGASLGVRHSVYDLAANNSGGLILERYFGSFRAVASTWKSRLDIGGDWVDSHQLQTEYYYGDGNYVGVSYSTGREVYVGWNLAPQVDDSHSWTLSGSHWVNNNWAATYQFVHNVQGEWYTRRGINVGIRHRF